MTGTRETTIVDVITTQSLSTPVRRTLRSALPNPDRSLPVVLCRVGASGSSDADERRIDDISNPLETTVTLLEGYVTLRNSLLVNDEGATDRDVALLASDHVHASAYAHLEAVPVTAERRLELYGVLADGSRSLANAFYNEMSGKGKIDHVLSFSADDCRDSDRGRQDADRPVGGRLGSDPPSDDGTVSHRDVDEQLPRPRVVLSGIAATLGATAVGADSTARRAFETVGRFLADSIEASDDEPYLEEIVIETLTETDRTERTTHFDGDDTNMTGTHVEPALGALDRLETALDPAVYDRLVRALAVPHRLQP